MQCGVLHWHWQYLFFVIYCQINLCAHVIYFTYLYFVYLHTLLIVATAH